MQTSAIQYKLIKQIKDDRFDEDLIHQYHLLINLGTKDLQTSVIDPQDNRVLFLEDFVIPNVSSSEELIKVLEEIYDAHALLKAGFWKLVRISIKNQKFVQVPQALYMPEAAPDYLKFNAQLIPSEEDVESIDNERADAVTVFAINKELRAWLQGIYPNIPVKFVHQSAALIEGVLQYADNQTSVPLYLYIDRFKLHILYCKAGKLIYYNQFTIKEFADYVKYIMLVMKSLNLAQETTKVTLWGYIGKNSPHYQEFSKYIRNVTFGNRPNYFRFGFVFDELQEHHFFDLYSIYLCK